MHPKKCPPSRLRIRFDKKPKGEIIIKDYGIFDPYGAATEAEGVRPEVGYIHSFQAAQELEFDLWLYDSILALSQGEPPLKGLRIEYKIDGKQVEYYVLFQVEYPVYTFSGKDFSHLTPLEEE